MMPKIIGAVLILTGCGGFGMMICMSYKREEEMLRQLILALNYIECELRYRITPLPELCDRAARSCNGKISYFFTALSLELRSRTSPDALTCVTPAKASLGRIPERVDKLLDQLAVSLGQFDTTGQIRSLEATKTCCAAELSILADHRDLRLRSYQTLGLCSGAALVILLV